MAEESASATASRSTSTTASSDDDDAISQSAPAPTATLQTRFRFYEPQELVSEENMKEEPKSTNRFNFYDETTRQELAAVENLTKASARSDTTDEILRSLQETEIQRLSILKADVSGSATTQKFPAGSATGESGSNPYEDAIKEALDLLRKHRSPPGTPALTTMGVIATESTPPLSVSVKTPASMESSNSTTSSIPDSIMRARTPRDKDRLLQHRMDENGKEDEINLAIRTKEEVGPAAKVNPLSPSAVVEDLTDAYEEHKLKAKQRQERMAQYASRLQEFKNTLPTEAVEQHWPPNLSNTQSHVDSYNAGHSDNHALIPHVPSQNGDSIAFSDLSQSTKEQVEAEVQRGVERVLLAILERANASRARSTQASVETSHSMEDVTTTGTAASDALLQAMEELGLTNPISNGSGSRDYWQNEQTKIRSKTSGETEGTGATSKKSATSVVDELLAEDEDDDILEDDDDRAGHFALADTASSPALSTHVTYGQSWGPREEKKLSDSQEKGRCHKRYDTIEEDEDDDGRLGEGRCKDEPRRMKGLLGPLSKRAGGTTGVVLDIDTDGEAYHDCDSKSTENDRSNTNYKNPFSSVMNYVAPNVSHEPDDDEDSFDRKFRLKEDKYQIADNDLEKIDSKEDEKVENVDGEPALEDEDEIEEDDASDDFEASELMRTLCAHFLPYGVDPKYNQLIEAIPDWDESNPNEAGYRIIRLSRLQLQRVELAFEKMINGLKLNSERQLESNSGDAQFARELQEVERLLDESEIGGLVAAEVVKPQVNGGSKSGKGSSVTTAVSVKPNGKPDLSINVDDEDDCHPSFPGVKATGKGEMGDLEYFHLPIIFKSHVTGFEPTKDLVLEPGNVVAGQYLVESELGSAAFSTAYRCIDLSTESDDGHEEVCLKVIKNTKDFFDQSLDEIKILELLRQTGKVHENHIVEMKCFFYYREHLVIVTELLRQNLFEFGKFILENNEEPYFTIPRLAYISRQALISLRFVHSLGLVHSDVKPENMLLSSYSRAQIKLIDFGSSCFLTDRQSSYIQSRSYRAPEVVLGLPYCGKIDVWSLGCVIAEMFTGEVTFQNDSIVSMLSRIEAICGPFPRHMIAQGRQSGRFFTKSGLLYEVVDDSEQGDGHKTAPGPHDDDDDDDFNSARQFDIFQPKNTRLCARLGFESDLMDDFDLEKVISWRGYSEKRQQQLFCEFIRQLLIVDPDGRPTADEALQHPWMLYAASLTEEQVKYPSS